MLTYPTTDRPLRRNFLSPSLPPMGAKEEEEEEETRMIQSGHNDAGGGGGEGGGGAKGGNGHDAGMDLWTSFCPFSLCVWSGLSPNTQTGQTAEVGFGSFGKCLQFPEFCFNETKIMGEISGFNRLRVFSLREMGYVVDFISFSPIGSVARRERSFLSIFAPHIFPFHPTFYLQPRFFWGPAPTNTHLSFSSCPSSDSNKYTRCYPPRVPHSRTLPPLRRQTRRHLLFSPLHFIKHILPSSREVYD